MIKKLATFFIFIIAAAAFFFAQYTYPNDYFGKLFLTCLAIAIVYVLFGIIVERIGKNVIRDSKTRYTFNKALSIISVTILLVIGIRIWIEDTQTLLVSYGIIAAGLAISLQDFFKNFVGGILIPFMGIYRVGDRIEIAEVVGDVMDIGILTTTILEIKGWVRGDQPTGRITIVPNEYVISGIVHNYTKDHNFIWDEISIPLTYDSNWREAIKVFLGIIQQETGESSVRADQEIEQIGEKYYLPKKVTEPSLYLSLTDNWIKFDIRYVTDVRNRRQTMDRVSRLILEEIEKSKTLRIASQTIEIVGTQEVNIIRKADMGEH